MTDTDEQRPLGQLVKATVRRANVPIVVVVVVLAAVSLFVQWRILESIAVDRERDEAVAAVVAAFAELATADTPAEQQAALDKIAEASEDLPEDSPVRRELEESTTTTSARPSGAGRTTGETAAPPPEPEPGTTTTTAGSTTTTEPSLIDLPPIDLPPVDVPPIPCLPFVCPMA